MNFNLGKRFGFKANSVNKDANSDAHLQAASKFDTKSAKRNWLSPKSLGKSSQIPFLKRSGQSSSKNKKKEANKIEPSHSQVNEVLVNDNNWQKSVIISNKGEYSQIHSSSGQNVSRRPRGDEDLFRSNSNAKVYNYYTQERSKIVQPMSSSKKGKVENDVNLVKFSKNSENYCSNLKQDGLHREAFKQKAGHKDNYGYIMIEDGDDQFDYNYDDLHKSFDSNQIRLRKDWNQCNKIFLGNEEEEEANNLKHHRVYDNSNNYNLNQDIKQLEDVKIKLLENFRPSEAENCFLNNFENETHSSLSSPTFLHKIEKDQLLNRLPSSERSRQYSSSTSSYSHNDNELEPVSSTQLASFSSSTSSLSSSYVYDDLRMDQCSNLFNFDQSGQSRLRKEYNSGEYKANRIKPFENQDQSERYTFCSKELPNTMKSYHHYDHLPLNNSRVLSKAKTDKPASDFNLIFKSEHQTGPVIGSSVENFTQEAKVKSNRETHSNDAFLYKNDSTPIKLEKLTSTLSNNQHFNNKLMQYQSCVAALEKENNMLLRELQNFEITSLKDDLIDPKQDLNSDNRECDKNETLSQLLLDRLKHLEEENSNLLLESEQQRLHYEKCLDDVVNQVVQALLAQKNLREECVQLHRRVRELENQNQYLNFIFRQHFVDSLPKQESSVSVKPPKLPKWPTLNLREKLNHDCYPLSSTTFKSVQSSLTSSPLGEQKFERKSIQALPLNHLNLESTSNKECQSSSLYSTKLPNDYKSSDNIKAADLIFQEKLKEKNIASDILILDSLQKKIVSLKSKGSSSSQYPKSPSSEAALHLIKDCLSKSESKSSKSVEMLDSHHTIDRPLFSSSSIETYGLKQSSKNGSPLLQSLLSSSQSNQPFSIFNKINQTSVFISSNQASNFEFLSLNSSPFQSSNDLISSKFSDSDPQSSLQSSDSSQSSNLQASNNLVQTENTSNTSTSSSSSPLSSSSSASVSTSSTGVRISNENNGESACKDEGYSTMSSDVQNDPLQAANMASTKLSSKSFHNSVVYNLVNLHRDADFAFDKMAVLREEENESKESEAESLDKKSTFSFENRSDKLGNKGSNQVNTSLKMDRRSKMRSLLKPRNYFKKSSHRLTFPPRSLSLEDLVAKQIEDTNLKSVNNKSTGLIKTSEKATLANFDDKQSLDSAHEFLIELSQIIAPRKVRLRCQPCLTIDTKRCSNQSDTKLKGSLYLHISNANHLLRCMYRSASDTQLYHRSNQKPIKLSFEGEECLLSKTVDFKKRIKNKKRANLHSSSNIFTSSSAITDELDFYVTPYFRRSHSKGILEEVSTDDQSSDDYDVDHKKFLHRWLHSESGLRWDDSEVTWKLNDPFLMVGDDVHKLSKDCSDNWAKVNEWNESKKFSSLVQTQNKDEKDAKDEDDNKKERVKKKIVKQTETKMVKDNLNLDSNQINQYGPVKSIIKQESNLNQDAERINFNRDFYRLCLVGSNKSIATLQNDDLQVRPNFGPNEDKKEAEKKLGIKKFSKSCVNKADGSIRGDNKKEGSVKLEPSSIGVNKRPTKSLTKGQSSNLPSLQRSIQLTTNQTKCKKENEEVNKPKSVAKSNVVKSSLATRIPQPRRSLSSDANNKFKEKVRTNLVTTKQPIREELNENKNSKYLESFKSTQCDDALNQSQYSPSQPAFITPSFSSNSDSVKVNPSYSCVSSKFKSPSSKLSKEIKSTQFRSKISKSNDNHIIYTKTSSQIPTAEELEKRLSTEKSISEKIKELNSLFKDEDSLKRSTPAHISQIDKESDQLGRKVLSRKGKIGHKSKEGHETSWVHLSGCSDPMYVSLINRKDIPSSSDSSDEDINDAKQIYEHLHALHRFRRQKKRASDKDMVISYVPRSRASIVDRHDFYYRFGEKEQEAVACFDFLEELPWSKSNKEGEKSFTNCLQANDSSEDEKFVFNFYLSSLSNLKQLNPEVVSQVKDVVSTCIDTISLSDSCADSYDGYDV